MGAPDKLGEKLLDLNIDLSRLTKFVNSRKDRDVVFTLRVITVIQVLRILKRVSPSKYAVIDVINARLFLLATPVITMSIARMINYSFSIGTFLMLETTKVTPLFKKGDASDPSHLIIVRFLSSQSYLIERYYVHDSLYDFL